MIMKTPTDTRKAVQEYYGAYARSSDASCCVPQNTLYPGEMLRDLPEDITGFFAGNGNPVTPARLQPGETVLDLGSGGGLDCFLSARQVGETGRVIGVDMTPDMILRSRQAAERLGMVNVAFRQGYLENLPVEDESVDVVISNCVINLSPDKPQVFQEIFRVLKPGGRISISDTVVNRPVPEEMSANMEDWCGCVSGALPAADYTSELHKAGFVDVKLEPSVEAARQAVESGQVQMPEGLTREAALKAVLDIEQSDRIAFLPYLISARKPD
jgi:arsenite methyltransferase